MPRKSPLRPPRVAAFALPLALAWSLIPLSASPAAATTGSEWGSSGTVTTESAVTVRWDNLDNPTISVVPRSAEQALPLTEGKTYADIRQPIRSAYETLFGSDNGYGGLTLSVSQTTNLVDQDVTLSFSGLPSFTTRDPKVYVQVFQCWGSPGSDGAPDVNATAPDPRTCQTGIGGTDLGSQLPDLRWAGGDNLFVGNGVVPFLPINGPETTEIREQFSQTTTNELSYVTADKGGNATRSFRFQTTPEATSLGCGRSDAPSTPSCWIVAVPIAGGVLNHYGMGNVSSFPSGLSPSIWAQRLQVQVHAADLQTGCGAGVRTLGAGSELATYAMSSWVPGLCSTRELSFGFSQLSDDQARRQLESGSAGLVFATAPSSASAQYVPTALTGVVFAYTGYYRPCGWELNLGGEPANENTVAACGYRDLAEATQELARDGSQIRSLNLNARLVAKLLTQTYGFRQVAKTNIVEKAPFLWNLYGSSLFTDPEFRALNPELAYLSDTAVGPKKLEVEQLKSDAAAEVWDWIVADEAARSFLNGCPDPWGSTINPWYSTRSYAECLGVTGSLETVAKAKRDATATPSLFDRESAPTYPPLTSPYPQVLYVESDEAGEGNEYQGPATLVDLLPPTSDQITAAKNTGAGRASRGSWCNEFLGGCASPLWKASPAAEAAPGNGATVIAVTDAASAVRYQLPTASLCNTSGDACVEANEATLSAQAARYTLSATTSALTEPSHVLYEDAYPLLAPVYAIVGTTGLTAAAAQRYADITEFITTEGQSQGYEFGNLRPGYVPLAGAFVEQAVSAIAALRTVRDADRPAGSPPAASRPTFVPNTVAPPASNVNAPVSAPSANQPVVRPGALTSATEIGFPQYGLLFGLGGAVLAGLLVPALGRSRKATEE